MVDPLPSGITLFFVGAFFSVAVAFFLMPWFLFSKTDESVTFQSMIVTMIFGFAFSMLGGSFLWLTIAY